MKNFTLIAICTFGLEAVVKKELLRMGYTIDSVSDGRVEFKGSFEDIARTNIWLRVADRVLIKLAQFQARDFDQLFDHVRKIDFGFFIPKDGKITVTGKSYKSKLSAVRTNQSMVKKAIIESLKMKYKVNWLEESGQNFTIQISLFKDEALLTLDTTGDGLHKRGYREDKGPVPIKENLAAALVMLSSWKFDQTLLDPMCGSGTILIEAAMIKRNIAPGLNRQFEAESWPCMEKKVWQSLRQEALAEQRPTTTLNIFGFDIDVQRIKGCLKNAKNAGVDQDICFEIKDLQDLKLSQPKGVLISNPPYGQKMGKTKDVGRIYDGLNNLLEDEDGWSVFIITSDKSFRRMFERGEPDKVRKLYVGTMEANYYQYFS